MQEMRVCSATAPARRCLLPTGLCHGLVLDGHRRGSNPSNHKSRCTAMHSSSSARVYPQRIRRLPGVAISLPSRGHNGLVSIDLDSVGSPCRQARAATGAGSLIRAEWTRPAAGRCGRGQAREDDHGLSHCRTRAAANGHGVRRRRYRNAVALGGGEPKRTRKAPSARFMAIGKSAATRRRGRRASNAR